MQPAIYYYFYLFILFCYLFIYIYLNCYLADDQLSAILKATILLA